MSSIRNEERVDLVGSCKGYEHINPGDGNGTAVYLAGWCGALLVWLRISGSDVVHTCSSSVGERNLL